jgi:hypothetical protein
VFAVITVASAILATAFARDRPRMVIVLGAAAVVATLLMLAVSPLVRHVAVAAAEGGTDRAAAGAIYDQMLRSLYQQSIVIIAAGGLLVIAGAAVRGRLTSESEDTTDVRRHVRALRIGGLSVAVAALLVWPQPSGEIIVAIGLVLAGYLALIQLLVSPSQWARSTRAWLAERLLRAEERADRDAPPAAIKSWARAHTSQLRWAGAAGPVLLVALIALPALSADALVAVIALTLLYFVTIELMANSAIDPAEETSETASEVVAPGGG